MAASLPHSISRSDAARLGGAVLESDCKYFELGAKTDPLDHAQLAWIPELIDDPAACVVQRVDAAAITDPAAWVDHVEDALLDVGAAQSRIYIHHEVPAALARTLQDRGYVERAEIAYLRVAPFAARRADVELRLVVDDDDWARKLEMHEACAERPDGYPNVASRWVELERTKCETGEMHAFLVEIEGVVSGAIGAIVLPNVVRAKNVVVRGGGRRQGTGAEAVRQLHEWGRAEGIPAIGIFGISGEAGDAMYRSIGMEGLATQYEWSRTLT